MVETWGLTHVAVEVADLDRSVRFYQGVFGSVVVYQSGEFVQLQTPGTRDVLVLERGDPADGDGGVAHFGFRLRRPGDIDAAADAVVASGGTITEKGEFVPGEPYLFARDPDGYLLEIWFELPTPVDPA